VAADWARNDPGDEGNVEDCSWPWRRKRRCRRRDIATTTHLRHHPQQLTSGADWDGENHDRNGEDIIGYESTVFIDGGMWRRPWGA